MLYEPPKTKKHILIGSSVIILAVLVVAFLPLIFKSKTTQTPTMNLPLTAEQQKIQKYQDKLVEMAKGQKSSLPSPEQIQKDQDRLIEEAKANGSGKSQQEIQKDQNNLINKTKK